MVDGGGGGDGGGCAQYKSKMGCGLGNEGTTLVGFLLRESPGEDELGGEWRDEGPMRCQDPYNNGDNRGAECKREGRRRRGAAWIGESVILFVTL